MKNYIFGDTGGHGTALAASLVELGLDPMALKLPDDVRIIHLGDLIHKGPNSNVILELVDNIMAVNPDNWVQLLGNHEFQHIKGSPYFWRCNCSVSSVGIINKWWENKQATAAYALPAIINAELEVSKKKDIIIPDLGILFTHSGITHPFWEEMGKLGSAVEVAEAINSSPIKIVSRPGIMLHNPHANNQNPGPAWALGSQEVFLSWVKAQVDMPFIQVHGHTAAFSWMHRNWYGGTPKLFKDATKLNMKARVSTTRLNNSLLVGLDPGFSEKIDLSAQPYLFIES
jgi:Calcineurin-like phosphoesterase